MLVERIIKENLGQLFGGAIIKVRTSAAAAPRVV